MKTLGASLLVLALAACSGDDDPVTMLDATLPTSDLAGNPDLASSPVHLKIRFDYRFDKAGFFTPPRKLALEAAAAVWGRLLTDDFATVPAGTSLATRDPQTPNVAAQMVTSPEDIDDLLVFVGSSDLPSGTLGSARPTAGLSAITDPTLATALDARFNGSKFEPWTAWASFDTMQPWFFDPTPDDGSDVPADQMDFMSVAEHELGHCLGIGSSPAWTDLVDTANHTFIGTRAVAAFGGPVPLNADDSHVANGTLSDGEPVLLDPSSKVGIRYRPSRLDLAIMQDLGYHL